MYDSEEDTHCRYTRDCYIAEDRGGIPSHFVGSPSKVETKDAINPKHYQRDDAMECIDEMILVFGKEKVKAFCLCNAWKYRYRAAEKNGIEDLKKSDWYMKKYKELEKEQEKSALANISRSINDNSIRLC